MDKLSEGINKLKDYFTLEGNKIKCDYCSNSYNIILNTEEVRKHVSQHKGYENAVSSKSSQEDLEQFYIIEENIIKCFECKEELCNPWNTRSIVYWHLEDGHSFGKEAEKNFREWLHNDYELHESNGKQICNECTTSVKNKPKHLMDHLREVHNRTCLTYMPNITIKKNSLDKLLGNWIWDFFIKKQENANCSVCDTSFKCLAAPRYRNINAHMINTHNENYDQRVQKYTEIQENLVKCDFCPEVFDVPFYINSAMKNHLEEQHGIDCDNKLNHDNISNYISNYFKKLGFQELQCNKCNKVLREVCYFQLRKHLYICQQINTSTEISLMGKSSSLLSSDRNVKDIDTSSGDPQPGSSKSLDIDVDDRNSGMKDLKRKSSDPSSSEPSCSYHFPIIPDDRYRGMKRVKYDDNKSSDESSSSSRSSLKPHQDTKNIATSNQCTEIEVLTVPTNVGSTEEWNVSTLPTETFGDVGDLDIEFGSGSLLNPTIGNINRETDQSPHSLNELPSTSSNILDDEDTEGIAASNIDQQSARDEIFNISPSNPLNLNLAALINELDFTYHIDNEDIFPEIDDQDPDNLNIP